MSLFNVSFVLNAFRRGSSRRLSEKNLVILLDALFKIDRLWLRANPGTPRLYTSGVTYQAEPMGSEHWRDIPSVLKEGYGDCEDLACWRAAELVEREGVRAHPVYRWRRKPGVSVYHIMVRLPDGSIEDPSRRLGMGKPRPTAAP